MIVVGAYNVAENELVTSSEVSLEMWHKII